MENLPEACYDVLSDGTLIYIKKGERGYHLVETDCHELKRNTQFMNKVNELFNISTEQRLAMECGSMFGWNKPGAKPSFWKESFFDKFLKLFKKRY